MRCSVLQVFRSSLFPRRKGLPGELDRAGEIQYRPISWTSVSVIFRWRPQKDQRDWNLTSVGFTIHALPWQPTGVMTSSYIAFDPDMLHSPLPFGIQAIWQG
jgi:hypothetical protein